MRDLFHNVLPVVTINPAAATASVTGTGVDLQDFESATIIVQPGTVTDGTHTPKLQFSPDNTAWTDVTVSQDTQLGTLAALVTNTVQSVGFIGGARYIRVFVTVAGATTGGVYGAVVVKGHPRHAPAAALSAQTP